jgi:hypothetical protein
MQFVALDGIMTDKDYEGVDQTHEEFWSCIACCILLFLSGATLQHNLQSLPCHGVWEATIWRFYWIQNSGQYTQCQLSQAESRSPQTGDGTVPIESWLQYGSPGQFYTALDTGPCTLMEITSLPKGLRMDLLRDASTETVSSLLGEKCRSHMFFTQKVKIW